MTESARPEGRRDVEAALAARRELGPDDEEHIAAGLAEHVDELVALRLVDTRVNSKGRARDREDERTARRHRFVLGVISLGAGIPVTGIAAGPTSASSARRSAGPASSEPISPPPGPVGSAPDGSPRIGGAQPPSRWPNAPNLGSAGPPILAAPANLGRAQWARSRLRWPTPISPYG